MRAIVLEKFGGLDSLVYKDIPEPEPKAGHVVIEIKAFGINHAEMHMRRGEWAEAAPVSGIECVGLVKSCPGGEFPVGAKVAALMGGLGRTINGSYAEYTRAPASNVALIEVGPAVGRARRDSRNLRDRLDLSVPQPRDRTGVSCSSSAARPPHSAKPRSRWPSTPGVRVIATTRDRDQLPHAGKAGSRALRDRAAAICRSTSPRRRRSMRCSTWWATASCSTPSPCCVAGAAPAWPAGSAGSIRSPTSTRCCRWRAAST